MLGLVNNVGVVMVSAVHGDRACQHISLGQCHDPQASRHATMSTTTPHANLTT